MKESRTCLRPRLTKYIPSKPTPKQSAFLLLKCLDAFYGGAAGGGKVLSDDGNILTPFGFKKGSKLKIGDKVNNPDGSIAKIIQIHKRQEYEKWVVKFHDGTKTTVTSGHLWLAWRARKRVKKKNRGCFGEEAAEIVETKTILDWLDRGYNPLIPVCKEQVFNVAYKYRSEIKPYLLGLLLGDGSLTDNGLRITTADKEIYEYITDNYNVGIYKHKAVNTYELSFRGESRKKIKAELIKLGVYDKKSQNKFIPRQYKMWGVKERYALVQGLLDTDGYVDERGQIYYTTISKCLAEDVAYVLRSLGAVVTISEKEAGYVNNGKFVKCQKAYELYIKHRDGKKLFRLKRKKKRAARNKPPLMFKKIVGIEISGTFTGRCITVSHPNGLYITDDFIVTHNSEALLMGALQYVDIPGYAALILRDKYSNLVMPGALMDRANDWLNNTDAYWSEKKKTWIFPSGATLTFGYLQNKNDHLNYKSSEFQYIGVDEASDIRPAQLRYMFSRLRKKDDPNLPISRVPLRMRLGSNPGGKAHEYLKKRYITGNGIFIPARLDDNEHVDKEAYLEALEQLDWISRQQLLEGNWDAALSGELFDRSWFKLVDFMPCEAEHTVRYWDLAATEGADDDTIDGPAFTVGVKMSRGVDKNIYVQNVIRFRGRPAKVDNAIKSTAMFDGENVDIWIEQEPGSGSKIAIEHYARLLAGFRVRPDKVGISKPDRAKGLSSYAEHGFVYLVRGNWNDSYLDEFHKFPKGEYKDQVDASSGAFNKVAAPRKIRVHSSVIGGQKE